VPIPIFIDKNKRRVPRLSDFSHNGLNEKQRLDAGAFSRCQYRGVSFAAFFTQHHHTGMAQRIWDFRFKHLIGSAGYIRDVTFKNPKITIMDGMPAELPTPQWLW
jgi:hypothetical protein